MTNVKEQAKQLVDMHNSFVLAEHLYSNFDAKCEKDKIIKLLIETVDNLVNQVVTKPAIKIPGASLEDSDRQTFMITRFNDFRPQTIDLFPNSNK